MRCAQCGAGLAPRATWCGLCHQAVAPPADPTRPPGWSPVQGEGPAPRVQTWSRWQGGTTSFGPVGRLTCTLLCLAVLAWLGVTNQLGAIVWLVVTPLLLRSIWKPVRTDVRRR